MKTHTVVASRCKARYSNPNRGTGGRHGKLLKFARQITQDPEILDTLRATAHLSSLNQKRVLSFAAQVVDWEAIGIVPKPKMIQCVSPDVLRARANSPRFRRRSVQKDMSKLKALRQSAMAW
jgi:hypothetical protein